MTCNQNEITGTLSSSCSSSQEKQAENDFSFNLKQEVSDVGSNDDFGERANKKLKKKYSIITQQVREQFISKVLSKESTIKQAAKEFGLKFSTSKAILQIYKKEGRIGKKKKRARKPRMLNTVIVATINPLSSGIHPLMTVNQVKTSELNQPNLSVNSNLMAETCLSQIQRNSLEFALKQQVLTATSNQDIHKLQSLMKPQTNMGLLGNLSYGEMKHQTLLNSVLQGQVPSSISTNHIVQQQQLLAFQNRQQLQQITFQQQKQQLQQQLLLQAHQQEKQRQQRALMLLNNLNLQNQLLIGMSGSPKGQIQPTLGGLNFDHGFPQEALSQATATQSLLNLNRGSFINPINIQDYKQFGCDPLKRVCYGEQKP